jgi:hypothetical protein
MGRSKKHPQVTVSARPRSRQQTRRSVWAWLTLQRSSTLTEACALFFELALLRSLSRSRCAAVVATSSLPERAGAPVTAAAVAPATLLGMAATEAGVAAARYPARARARNRTTGSRAPTRGSSAATAATRGRIAASAMCAKAADGNRFSRPWRAAVKIVPRPSRRAPAPYRPARCAPTRTMVCSVRAARPPPCGSALRTLRAEVARQRFRTRATPAARTESPAAMASSSSASRLRPSARTIAGSGPGIAADDFFCWSAAGTYRRGRRTELWTSPAIPAN